MSLRNDELANILEKFGADRNDDLRKLVADEIQAEEKKTEQAACRSESRRKSGDTLDTSGSAEREDEIDALLMAAVGKFGGA